LPTKATKHITRHQQPVGAVKGGRLKVQDGDTGKISWRQGNIGFSKDWDGEPIAENYNAKDLKPRPRHHTHTGKKETHKTYMGNRPEHKPK
jgi:hypothetical protein